MFKRKKNIQRDTQNTQQLAENKHILSSENKTADKKKSMPKKSKKRIVFWFVILSLTGFLFLNIQHNLQKKQKTDNLLSSKLSETRATKSSEIPVTPKENPAPENKEPSDFIQIDQSWQLDKNEISTDDFISETVKKIDDMNLSNIPQNTQDNNVTTLEDQIETALSTDDRASYSLQDALIFRDHFLSEQPCGNDFRKLILTDNKTEAAKNVIKETSYFCLTTNNVYGELNSLFETAKKNALIQYYKDTCSKYKARFYIFLTYIIRVRNLNPIGDSVPALLDRAQNATQNKNIALATQTIRELPSQLQAAFADFLQKAKNYADASKALENLILSYAKGE